MRDVVDSEDDSFEISNANNNDESPPPLLDLLSRQA